MRARLFILGLATALLTGCGVTVVQGPGPAPGGGAPQGAPMPSRAQISARAEGAVRQFVQVVRTVEPVAEDVCAERAPRLDCDFRIVVDDREGQPPNAFQTVDSQGRPVIAFTLGLLLDVQNADELAFVMSHEAAHHIAGHLDRQQVNASAGARVFGGLASITGAGAQEIEMATRLGAAVGARRYSKDFELEADRMGARIALRAGYDPVNGARYFTRIPDPGDSFLGTHPPNAQRIEVVRRAIGG